MKHAFLIGIAALAALAACEDTSPTVISTPAPRTGSPDVEAACVALVDSKYDKQVATVMSSQPSGDGTEVMLAAEGETFRCVKTYTGNVELL